MKFSKFGILAGLGLLSSAVAEDILFLDALQGEEVNEAAATDGYTVKVVTPAQWSAMSTVEFASYKAIVFADEFGGADAAALKLIEDTKAVWSPAVTGNMIIIGTDPSNHFSNGGAKILIDDAIKFAASGVSPTGQSLTGLYFALSHYYDTVDTATVTPLSYFGNFEVRGNLNCYNTAHLVASSPAIARLTDASLSDWSCSVHEAFTAFPTSGMNGFQTLAIAKDIVGAGTQTFGDGTMGLPYIISRGATPAGCGNGVWEPSLGEECDDSNTANGDGCSASCKCESGRPKGDGTCLPKLTASGTAPISSPISSSVPYGNSTTPSVPVSTTPPTIIIGVEIIIEIIIIENCQTINPTSTITQYVTSTCSTKQQPIFATSTPGYPCYPCQMASQGIPCPSGAFITATTIVCPKCSGGALPTPILPVVQPCHSCEAVTLLTAPTCASTATIYAVPVPTVTVSQERAPVPYTSYTTFATGTVKATVPASKYTGAAAANVIPGVAGGLMAMVAMLL